MKKNNDMSIYYKNEKLFQLRCVSPAWNMGANKGSVPF